MLLANASLYIGDNSEKQYYRVMRRAGGSAPLGNKNASSMASTAPSHRDEADG
jgi:hypothetical protein